MTRNLRVYLCGSIQKGSTEKRSIFWSDDDIAELRRSAKPTELVILNPGDRVDDLSDVRATFGRDILQVFTSDVVIADARARRGIGVGAELLFAKSQRIPVVTIVPPNSHYHRTNVLLMGQLVDEWTHPFLSELSDVIARSVAEAGAALVPEDAFTSVRGPECFERAMSHYLVTQRSREPEMVRLLVGSGNLPKRTEGLVEEFLELAAGSDPASYSSGAEGSDRPGLPH